MNRATVWIEVRFTEDLDFGETRTTVTRCCLRDCGDNADEAQHWYDQLQDWTLDQVAHRGERRILDSVILGNDERNEVERSTRVEVLSLDDYEPPSDPEPNPFD